MRILDFIRNLFWEKPVPVPVEISVASGGDRADEFETGNRVAIDMLLDQIDAHRMRTKWAREWFFPKEVSCEDEEDDFDNSDLYFQ